MVARAMTIIEKVLILSAAFAGLLGLVLAFIASVVALFKIDEADRYFGEWDSPEQLYLKGLPFSFHRMTFYGLTILFKGRHIVKRFDLRGKEHLIDHAPVRLKRLLVWLYTSWVVCFVFAMILGGISILLSKL